MKTDKVRLFIPIPYVFLTIGIMIMSSERLQKLINKWIVEHSEDKEKVFAIPPIDKKELRAIVTELKNHKGLGLVNVKAKDGTEVIVKL
ncbi:hypothetical protein AB1K89_12795 [Sporosarcina sp. 179-K 8C2 HS]|uniref:hypothetical protein n=1 Tax=Sporosarcina sp. 179-K 8C2 HS TaxID=3142387 RepID=UPI00399EEC7C